MPIPDAAKYSDQSSYMEACMHEASKNEDRTNEQNVAICLSAWREAHGGKKPKSVAEIIARWKELLAKKEMPDPADYDDKEEFMSDCVEECEDDDDPEGMCEMAWENRGVTGGRGPEGPTGLAYKTHAETVGGMEFVLSDETPDRMDDIIMSDGWVLDAFQKNPIALFAHNPQFIVGRWKNLRIENKALRGRLELAPKGTSDRIDEIRKLVEADILRAVSVGFRPIEAESLDKKNPFSGSRFTKQELIETSLVSVPANPNALAIAKSLNISATTMDLVFAKHGREANVRRRDATGKHAKASRNDERSGPMSLAQRIVDQQNYIKGKQDELEAHMSVGDDTNVTDEHLEKSTLLNSQIKQGKAQLAVLQDFEKNVGATTGDGANGNGTTRRSLVTSTAFTQGRINGGGGEPVEAPIIIKPIKKDWEPLDYMIHAGVILTTAKSWNVSPDVARVKIYGDDEAHKVVFDWATRAPSAPAFTTVAGWAQELVQQIYATLLELLMPNSVFPRLSGKGLTLTFGRAGRIILPMRSRTPTISGSFVGEGLAIPVRQGAFTSVTYVPKKLAVITTFTREMADHSIPAIEGVLREAIQQDTAVALDSVLLDANPATAIRPAGLLNGVGALTATAGGGIAAVLGDIKQLVGALTVSTYGNIRAPAWLMNPSDMLSASLAMAANTGIFPFRDEIARGTLNTIPIVDSATVPLHTVILVDAADFVTMPGDAIRWDISDSATLHMEDTTPLDLVSGSPGTVASPQRSLFQTDSLALRMITPLNWALRRSGMVQYTTGVTW